MSNTRNPRTTSKRSNLSAHGGRFVTLNIKNRSTNERVCAKIVKLTDNYVTFLDVNAKTVRKVSRNSIV